MNGSRTEDQLGVYRGLRGSTPQPLDQCNLWFPGRFHAPTGAETILRKNRGPLNKFLLRSEGG